MSSRRGFLGTGRGGRGSFPLMSTVGKVDEPMGGEGFEALYRDRYVALVRLAYLLLGTRASGEAEEVVQEAFAELHRCWALVEVPGAYVRTAVVNGCRKRQRRGAMDRVRVGALPERSPAALGCRLGPSSRCPAGRWPSCEG